jgi:TPR repeat protein
MVGRRRLALGAGRVRRARPGPGGPGRHRPVHRRAGDPARSQGSDRIGIVKRDDLVALHGLGVLHAGQGRADEALTWFERAAEAGFPEAIDQLSTLLDARGRTAEAQEWRRHGEDGKQD